MGRAAARGGSVSDDRRRRIGRTSRYRPRTRPRAAGDAAACNTARGNQPAFRRGHFPLFARCAPLVRVFASAQPSARPHEAQWRRGSCWWTPMKWFRCRAGADGGGRFGGGLGLSVSLTLISLIGHAGVRLLGCLATPPHLPRQLPCRHGPHRRSAESAS